MEKLLLIDADYAPHAFGQRPEFDAIIRTDEWLEFIYEKCGTRNCIIFLSGDKNFRYKIGTIKPYKGNRKDRELPQSFESVRSHLLRKPRGVEVVGAEADDAIIISKRHYQDKYDCIIVADDKDFLMETGKHYRHSSNELLYVGHEIVNKAKSYINPDDVTDIRITYETKYYGDFMLYYQMLIGDSADNIPGIPGIGANNVIFKTEFINGITVKMARQIVWREYLKYYKDKAVSAYLEMYRLLRLMNNPNILY